MAFAQEYQGFNCTVLMPGLLLSVNIILLTIPKQRLNLGSQRGHIYIEVCNTQEQDELSFPFHMALPFHITLQLFTLKRQCILKLAMITESFQGR